MMAVAGGRMRVGAIVPLKSLSGAKQRLANALIAEEREALVAAMLRDVLSALLATPSVDRVTVVSNSTDIADIAFDCGATVMSEGEPLGLSEAVASAAARLEADNVSAMMVVHGDIPLATANGFQAVIDAAGPAPSVTIAPCRNNDGTNVMICSPPTVIPFLYGPDSCAAHQAAAGRAGIAARIIPVGELSLDIDTPADLVALMAQVKDGTIGPETAKVLSEIELAASPG